MDLFCNVGRIYAPATRNFVQKYERFTPDRLHEDLELDRSALREAVHHQQLLPVLVNVMSLRLAGTGARAMESTQALSRRLVKVFGQNLHCF